jgi:hypothetical protein
VPQLFSHRVGFALFAVLALSPGRGHATTDAAYVPRNDARQIQALVDAFLRRLEIPDRVSVVLVATNPLLVSVERHPGAEGFLLSVEDRFVDTLSEEELQAVLAHELGHVWIFTHHPYLHTEELANRIALRVVSRDILAQVYVKVWERAGTKGDLAIFIGPERTVSADTVRPASSSAISAPTGNVAATIP